MPTANIPSPKVRNDGDGLAVDFDVGICVGFSVGFVACVGSTVGCDVVCTVDCWVALVVGCEGAECAA